MGRPRIGHLLAASLTCALLVAGCSSLPTSSAPQPFDIYTPSNAPIDFAAGGPVDGSTPDRLVQDFLLACAAGTFDDFTTARLFLTQDMASTWDPTAQVQIFPTDASPHVNETDDDGQNRAEVELSAPAIASVDASGVLTRATESRISGSFVLVKENGQWRIDSLPDGTIISQASFQNSYARANLYFPSIGADTLIADPRWYPSRQLAPFLLQGLLAGPREELATAVGNAIPEGMLLDGQGLEISDTVASVHLTGPAPADQASAATMLWQLQETLKGARNISTVEVTISGARLEAQTPERGATLSLDSPVVLTQSGLGRLSGSSIRTLVLPEKPSERATLPAVGPLADSVLAWRDGPNIIIVDPLSGAVRTVAAPVASTALPLSIDRYGWVWSPNGEGTQLLAWHVDGREVSIDLPREAAVGGAFVSPDGVKLLILRELGGRATAWLGVVGRQADGSPTAVEILRNVDDSISDVRAASWAGVGTIVIVHHADRATEDDRALATVDIGGFAQYSQIPSGVVSASAGASPAAMVIESADGTLQLRSGALWQAVPSEIVALRYPG